VVSGIKKPPSIQGFMQVLQIWEGTRNYNLHQHAPDEWTWLWESKEVYSVKSVYKTHLAGSIKCDSAGNLGVPGLHSGVNLLFGSLSEAERALLIV
jgi:hypothetical protein